MALAVQPTETWRELWIFRNAGAKWTIRVLPPAATTPDIGYIEFAGWVPGGAQRWQDPSWKRQTLSMR